MFSLGQFPQHVLRALHGENLRLEASLQQIFVDDVSFLDDDALAFEIA
jgi:hypothetical protein